MEANGSSPAGLLGSFRGLADGFVGSLRDRIELLRPLQCDPMQARRLRAGKTGARRG